MRRNARTLYLSLLLMVPGSAKAEGTRFTIDGLAGWWLATAQRVRPGQPVQESSATTQNVLVLEGRYIKMTGTLPGEPNGVPVIAYLGLDAATEVVSLVWIDGAAASPRLYSGKRPASGVLELGSPSAEGPDRLRLDPGDGTRVTFRFERTGEPGHLEMVLEKR